MASSACFPIGSRTARPEVAPPTVGWALPHKSSTKKIYHRLGHRPIWWGQFLSWVPLSQMCRVGIKPASTACVPSSGFGTELCRLPGSPYFRFPGWRELWTSLWRFRGAIHLFFSPMNNCRASILWLLWLENHINLVFPWTPLAPGANSTWCTLDSQQTLSRGRTDVEQVLEMEETAKQFRDGLHRAWTLWRAKTTICSKKSHWGGGGRHYQEELPYRTW